MSRVESSIKIKFKIILLVFFFFFLNASQSTIYFIKFSQMFIVNIRIKFLSLHKSILIINN